MKPLTRSGAFLVLLLGLLGLGLLPTGCTSSTSAEGLMMQAEAAREATSFTHAAALYEQAQAAFVAAGDETAARVCVEAVQDMEITMVTYPYTAADMLAELEKAFPQVPAEDRAAWLERPSIEKSVYDGAPHYFQSLPENIAYRDVALFRSQPSKVEGIRALYQTMLPHIQTAASADPTRPYAAPSSYTFTQTLVVPRSELPATGLFRTWFPLPIEGGPQTNVKMLSVTPTTYLTFPASTSEDIGLLYLEVPLETLAADLTVQVTFSFDHAPQYFRVDPDKIGRYDTESALYKQYTASHDNTSITPDIRATARRVVGAETNPYRAARLLYYYVLDNIHYSFMPHPCLHPRGMPESEYVHTYRRGDCGAQSIYFSALCRSVGIPARTTGGFQLFSGTPAGHFWAEFYLPNYGWIPVDTSAGQLSGYLPDLSEAENNAYRDFFFGNQDPLRFVVQRDTDLPLIPEADGLVLLPMAIQWPAALCDTMTEIPGALTSRYWTIK